MPPALDVWTNATAEEQLDAWLGVPERDVQVFVAAARPAARLVFEAIPALALNGDTAGDRVVIKKALQRGNWMEHAGELSRLSQDDERLSRFVELLRWSRMAAAQWRQNLDGVLQEQWPAYELHATIGRVRPGTKERWQQAGGRLFGGKMIALKTDPVWARFSQFGRPHPPYDTLPHYLDVRGVDWDAARRMRLIAG